MIRATGTLVTKNPNREALYTSRTCSKISQISYIFIFGSMGLGKTVHYHYIVAIVTEYCNWIKTDLPM